jgi:hypothetical protein
MRSQEAIVAASHRLAARQFELNCSTQNTAAASDALGGSCPLSHLGMDQDLATYLYSTTEHTLQFRQPHNMAFTNTLRHVSQKFAI